METSYKTVAEVRNIIGVNNRVLNIYNQTLHKGLVHPRYLVDANVWDLRDYHLVKPAFESKLIELKEEILAFKKDFYESKTANVIAQRAGLAQNIVISYLQKRMENFAMSQVFNPANSGSTNIVCYPTIRNLGKITEVLPTTEFNQISSFRILADIQNTYIAERISLLT